MSRKSIIFVTGNKRKMGEAVLGCALYDIDVVQKVLAIQEIQSIHPHEVGAHKAEQAFAQVGQPVVVADSFWSIPALGGFPGAYMKDVVGWFTSEDFLNLIRDKEDKRISFTECVVYKDAERTQTFVREYWGEFVDPPRGEGNSIENVAAFEGATLGEKRSQGGYSHKPEEYIWAEFGKWYSEIAAIDKK